MAGKKKKNKGKPKPEDAIPSFWPILAYLGSSIFFLSYFARSFARV